MPCVYTCYKDVDKKIQRKKRSYIRSKNLVYFHETYSMLKVNLSTILQKYLSVKIYMFMPSILNCNLMSVFCYPFL